MIDVALAAPVTRGRSLTRLAFARVTGQSPFPAIGYPRLRRLILVRFLGRKQAPGFGIAGFAGKGEQGSDGDNKKAHRGGVLINWPT